jgi:hypothetical protein
MTLATGWSEGRIRRKGWVTFGRVGMILNSSSDAFTQGAFKLRTNTAMIQKKRPGFILILSLCSLMTIFFHSLGTILFLGLINFIPTLQ